MTVTYVLSYSEDACLVQVRNSADNKILRTHADHFAVYMLSNSIFQCRDQKRTFGATLNIQRAQGCALKLSPMKLEQKQL